MHFKIRFQFHLARVGLESEPAPAGSHGLGTPPGRGGSNFLWLRTRLAGKNFHDPALFLLSMDQIFEAYLDGKLIYRFGVLDGPGSGRYAGHRPHYLPLGPGYQGKLLALRV